MKKICLLLLLHAAAQESFAQNKKLQTLPVAIASPVNDQRRHDVFTIVLRPAIRNTFLFSIYREGKLLHTQVRHPQTLQALGFSDREAAYAYAGELIGNYQQTGNFPQVQTRNKPTLKRNLTPLQ